MGGKTVWIYEAINRLDYTLEDPDMIFKSIWRNLEIKTESFLIVAESETKKTDYIKAKINYTQ